MAGIYGAREAAIAKELTKLHESLVRGTLAGLRRRSTLRQSSRASSWWWLDRPAQTKASRRRCDRGELEMALKHGELSRRGAQRCRDIRPQTEPRVRAWALAPKRQRARDREPSQRFSFASKGHRIVARRYKTPVGEIDLVALKGKRLAFVEVKQRKTLRGRRLDAADPARRRIVRAAQYWLTGNPDFTGHDIAFDVVLAAPWAWPRYIANAFPVY